MPAFLCDWTSGSKKIERTIARIWRSIAIYLDTHADPHNDEGAFLDTSFPAGKVVVVVCVDDQEVYENDPENVDDDGIEEDQNHFPLMALS